MQSTTWRRRATKVLIATAVTVTAILGGTVATAGAACPNEALRVENNSTRLPDCRAYELVSSPFKEGFMPIAVGFTDDGRFAYQSTGNFANNGLGSGGGNLYVADRSASGWSTTPHAPSGPEYNLGLRSAFVLSRDLRSSLWNMSRADQPTAVGEFYVRRPDGTFTRIGPSLDQDLLPPTAPGGSADPPDVAVGVSDDLSHVIAWSNFDAATGGPPSDLYEYVGTGHERPRLVSANNVGQRLSPACGALSGPSFQHQISADGRVIFWTSQCTTPAMYARVDGTTTIEVSMSVCNRAPADPGGLCNAAQMPAFQGASADGTRVYFTTSQQLVDADTDATQDLYECDIPTGALAPVGAINPCPSLHEVSGAGSGANVEGVTRISEDGSRAYFVATGILASNLGANDVAAVAGDHNLYVWQRDAAHPSGETTFVAKLDPGDVDLWAGGRPAQATDDGRYLAFVSRAALIDSGPQADADSGADVYRYDAATGALRRLSTDVDGNGGNEPGHDAQFRANVYSLPLPTPGPRGAMTDDGGAVVFATEEALSPTDTNGSYDVYLWQDGRVSLISNGGPSGDGPLGILILAASISPSGRDIYFSTTAQLTANDVDTQVDFYDARVDGGFDLSSPATCTADVCQGPAAAPPATPRSGTAAATGETATVVPVPAFSIGVVSSAQRKRFATTGKLTLTVSVNGPGTVSAAATATVARRSTTVASARRTAAKGGIVPLALTLSKKARTELASKGKLTVKVAVSYSKIALGRSVTLKLMHAKAARKGGVRRAVVAGDRS